MLCPSSFSGLRLLISPVACVLPVFVFAIACVLLTTRGFVVGDSPPTAAGAAGTAGAAGAAGAASAAVVVVNVSADSHWPMAGNCTCA